MSQHDRDLSIRGRTASGEVPFDPSEIFFSRTDGRGVIIEGNKVFRRISGYSWEELTGAPHKIVRNADMPKGVFQLFWDRLKAGQRVVAYVKNSSKDGRYYWVLALAWPVEGGYLSVRIKPTSELRTTTEALYADLLAAEADEALTPEASAERLLVALQEKGFDSYDDFMAAALRAEVVALSHQTHVAVDHVVKRYFEMYDTVCALGEEVEKMVDVIRAIRTVPMNMRILASRLENAGGPLSAISVNYSQMLEEMSLWIKDFAEGPNCAFTRIRSAIVSGQLLVCAIQVQDRMLTAWRAEMELDKELETDARTQRSAALEHERTIFAREARDSLTQVEREVRRLSRSVLDMKRFVTGLSSTRMMCKIESAALGNSDTALNGIVEQLDGRQDDIETQLAKIVEMNSKIQSINTILSNMS